MTTPVTPSWNLSGNKVFVLVLAGILLALIGLVSWQLSWWWLLAIIPWGIAGIVTLDCLQDKDVSYLHHFWKEWGSPAWKEIHTHLGPTAGILVGLAICLAIFVGGGWYIAATWAWGKWAGGGAAAALALLFGWLGYKNVPAEYAQPDGWDKKSGILVPVFAALMLSSVSGSIISFSTAYTEPISAPTPPGSNGGGGNTTPPPPAASADHKATLRTRVEVLQKKFGGSWEKTPHTVKMPWTAVPAAHKPDLLAKANIRLGELAAMIGGELTGAKMDTPATLELGYNPDGSARMAIVWVTLKTASGTPIDGGRPQGIEMAWWATDVEAEKLAEDILTAVSALR